MQQEFITKLGKARAELTAAQERDLVLRLAKNDVVIHLNATSPPTASRSSLPWRTGGTSTPSPSNRSKPNGASATKLAGFLKDLGYE